MGTILRSGEERQLYPPPATTRVERWGLVLIYVLAVAGYPAISSIPLWLGIDSRMASVPYRAVVLAVSLVMTVYALHRRRLYVGLFWIPLTLFLGGYILRLSVDTIYAPLSMLRMSPGEYWLYAIGTCFIPMFPFFMAADDRTVVLALRIVFVATWIACLLAVVTAFATFFSGGPLSGVPGMRLGTDTLNPISLGQLGVSLMILAVSYMMFMRPASIAVRLFIAISIILGMFTALAAASKGPLLVLLLIAPVFMWSGFRMGMRGQVVVFGVIASIALYAGAQYVENSLGFDVIGRLEALSSGDGDDSSLLRQQFMSDAWGEFVEHPVLGSAVDELNSHEYPHNVVIESFMTTGVAGGSLFLILLIASASAAVVVLRFRPMCTWIVLLYIQAIVGAQVSGTLYESGAMWCFMAAMVGLAATVVISNGTSSPELRLS